MSAPKRTSFNKRMRHVLGVISNILLLISSRRNPVPRAGCILHGTLRRRLGPVIIVGGVSHPSRHISSIRKRVLRLFVRLGTSSRRLSFPLVCTSTEDNVTGLRVGSRKGSLRPLFSAVLRQVPTPRNSPSKKLRVVIAALRTSSCLNGITVNHIAEKAIGRKVTITVASKRGVHASRMKRLFG